MTPETALQAGQLLRDMTVLQGTMDVIDAAADNGTFLAGGPVPTDDPHRPFDLPMMTPEESKGVFAAMRKVLEARVKLLTAKLDKL